MPQRILALNVGSSSLKYALFDARGPGGGIDTGRRLRAAVVTLRDSRDAAEHVVAELDRAGMLGELAAVGHRIVHGGARYVDPARITPSVRAELEQLVPLAPEHLPRELGLIDAMAERLSLVPQIACFDTAFHRDLPRVATLFGIPREYAREGMVRYGFHGLSYEYVVDTLRREGALPRRVVIAHLGNGASLVAVRDGRSEDTSMGFTPTGGIVMGTRSGDIDPGVLLFLLRERRLSCEELDRVFNERGGLLGVSETTSDMRELLARAPGDVRAADAVALFAYRVKTTIGAYAAALGGLDMVVFTGGIGEHAADVRAMACEGLEWMGVRLDPARNAANAAVVSADGTPVAVRVLPTDEERTIARHAARLVAAERSRDHRGDPFADPLTAMPP
jgi:acetate kinase